MNCVIRDIPTPVIIESRATSEGTFNSPLLDMNVLDYAEVPLCAALLPPTQDVDKKQKGSRLNIRPVALDPVAGASGHGAEAYKSPPLSPTIPKANPFSFSNILISSAINFPTSPPPNTNHGTGAPSLLTNKDPLALQITTANFRRFVSRVGFVFWLQDRIEEILMWRKGWKYTSAWLVGYGVICERAGSWALD